MAPEIVEREAASEAVVAVAPGPVLVSARGLSKAYVPPTRSRLGARLVARLGGPADLPDEEEDEDELDPEEAEARAAGLVVRDVDLDLHAGTATGIAGPPNSGKTTLMELLAGLTPPTAGTVVQAGRVVPILDALPKLMTDGSAWRNVVLLARVMGHTRGWARKRLETIFTFAGLTGSEELSRSAMPVAEVQKLAVATMLHVEGRVYLVDSTLGGRDHAFRQRCLERLAGKQAAGAAIVHTARELEGVQRLCDHVLWLERGSVVASGSPEDVGEAVLGRRTLDKAVVGPQLTSEARQLLEFLRVALGDVHAQDALHAAKAAAESAGEDRIEWVELAVAAGYDVSEAQRIVDRLARRAGKIAVIPTYNEQAAIVGASASGIDGGPFRADRESSIRVRIEAATGGIEIGCALVFVDAEGGYTRIDQPERYAVERIGLYEAEVIVPPETLGPGAHRATVLVGVVARGVRTLLFRRDLLLLDGAAMDDGLFDTIEPYDPADADAEFRRPAELEWHVRRIDQ
jgi:ABC-type polysaccharide/polyol phosphate transport system ATPase subunit